MKKLVCLVLTVVLALSAVSAFAAEYSTDDYSWLDDLTIKQLKELDAEIHNRIPNTDNEDLNTENDSILIGSWRYEGVQHIELYEGHIFNKVIELAIGGVGELSGFDITTGKSLGNRSLSYEMKSDSVVVMTYHGGPFGDSVDSFTLYEDDEGIHLKSNTSDEVYSKYK